MPKYIEVEFPTTLTPVVWLAMFAGLLLVVLAFGGQHIMGKWAVPSSVLLGSGIGIILAAFGGQATIRGKGYVFAGVAAVSIGLMAFVEYQTGRERAAAVAAEQDRIVAEAERIKNLNRSVVLGRIQDIPASYHVYMRSVRDVRGFIDIHHAEGGWERSRDFAFVALRRELSESGIVRLELIKREGAPDGEYPEIQVFLDVGCLQRHIGSGEEVIWRWNETEQEVRIVDSGGTVVAKRRFEPDFSDPDNPYGFVPCKDGTVERRTQTSEEGRPLASILRDLVFPSARAQLVRRTDPPQAGPPDGLERLVRNLGVDDVDLRRSARIALARLSPEQSYYLFDALRANLESERITFGITMALTEMLRDDKSKARPLAELMSEDDIGLMLDLAGHPDRMIRIHATEFLYDLDNPRVSELAIRRASDTDDATARFQWLFIAQSGWGFLDVSQRSELRPLLDAARGAAGRDGTRTRALIERFN